MYRATHRRPGGFALIVDPDAPGGQTEFDTLACGHCNRVLFPTEVPAGGGCYQCGTSLCKACVDAGVCSPFELFLDVHEGTPTKGRWAETFAEWNAKRLGRR